MKRTKLAAILSLPVTLALSVNSIAATERDALQACSTELTKKLEATQDSEITAHVDQSGIDPTRYVRTKTVFHFSVPDHDSRESVAKFDCFVDKRGRVKSLRTLALNARSAAERS